VTDGLGVQELLEAPTEVVPAVPGIANSRGNGARQTESPSRDGSLSQDVLQGDLARVALSPPRRTREFGLEGAALLTASALSSFAVIWVLFYQLTLLSGALGFVICWYACFLLVFWVVTAQVVDRSAATDRVMATVMTSCAAISIGALLYIVFWVFVRGVGHFSLGFLYKTLADYQPADKNLFNDVGVGHAIVGTLEQVALAAVMAVPLAFLTAIFLNEVGGFGTRFVRTIVTAMSGVPSIVAGVFIYATFIVPHYLGYSGFAASMALFVLMLPSVTRTTEEVLRVVPGGLREAALALGASEWRMVRQVVLPTARSGLVTAVVLGVAIAAGETAPLIFTAFGANTMNFDPFHGPQAALPLVLYENISQAQAVVVQLAFTAAFVLLFLVLILFILARLLGRRSTRKGRLRSMAAVPVRWGQERLSR
jgi:phosphate transport system permease protein